MAKIDSVYDFTDKALVELKSWLEPWFRTREGCECVPAAPSGDTIDAIIAGLGPDAWWKLNESSGVVAHDSSGNGHDLTAAVGFTAPTWGQPAGPPGTTTAKWGTSTTRVSSSVASPLTGFTDNFTAGVWVNVHTDLGNEILGQGTGGLHVSPGGWAILVASGKFAAGVIGNLLLANNTFALDTWYFVALVRDAGTWKLYVNGLLQTATYTYNPAPVDGTNTWIGNDAYASHTTYLQDTRLSYAFIFNSVLTGAQLLSIYNSAVLPAGANAGKALIATGLGGTYWDFASAGSGTTAARPTLTANGGALFVGTGYFDTTLGKPIWWNGTVWKDATGTTV